MVEIRIDGNDFGVGDGGQVDGLRGVQTTGVDQQLQRLQSNRRILTFGAGKNRCNLYTCYEYRTFILVWKTKMKCQKHTWAN